MKCPVCKTIDLAPHELETNLLSSQCPQCGGSWVASFQYWKWRDQHGLNLPETLAQEDPLPTSESDQPKICPECSHILIAHKVGHDLTFSLDRCGNCGGMWFDRNEWESLKSRNLHDDVHFIFTQPWQADVAKKEHALEREEILLAKFGEEDLAEIRHVKRWIDSHPKRNELLAFLLYPDANER